MLVLSRKLGERIVIGENIVVTVVSVSGDRIRLGVSAPAGVPIHREEIFRRYEGNPILTAAEWPHTVNAVFNPAVVEFEGETLLLARVETRTGISHLGVARSADGLTNWVIDHDRDLLPDLTSHAEEFAKMGLHAMWRAAERV